MKQVSDFISKMAWNMLMFSSTAYVLVLIVFVTQSSKGTQAVESTKRQNLIPSARLGRELFFTDEDTPSDLYPSLEESMEFSTSDPDYIDSEVFMSAESDNEGGADDLYKEPLVERKKRSLSDEDSNRDKSQNQQVSSQMKSNWNEEAKSDLYKEEKRKPRNKLIFIPRIGKKSYDDENSYASKRVVFIPRIGKKNVGDIDFPEDKRAIFIPRIGKREYTNLGNPDAKKAIFIPRIGRGAAFLPKIVRYNPQHKVTARVVFIPRIG